MTNTLNENGHWVQDNKLDANSSDRNMDRTYSTNQETETNGTNLNESLNEDSISSLESSNENLSVHLSEMNHANASTPNVSTQNASNHNALSQNVSIHHESTHNASTHNASVHNASTHNASARNASTHTTHHSIYNNHLGCTSKEVLINIDEAIDNVVKHFTINKNDLNESTKSTKKIDHNSKVTKSTKASSKSKSKSKNYHSFFDQDDLPFELNSTKKKDQDKSHSNRKKECSTGPFIRVEKKKNQVNYTVVNNSSKLEDKDNKLFNKPNYSSIAKKSSNQILFKPNDPTWICVFCKRAPHYKQLGDLFGPHELVCDKNFENTSLNNSTNSPSTSYSPNKNEIWFHEDCIIWSNGIYLAGNRVLNIDEIVIECSDITCCVCKLIGANLGCVQKGCNQTFHYICAKESGCELDEENFSMFCQNHKKSIEQNN